MPKKTDEELILDARGAGHMIDYHWPKAFPVGGNTNLEGLQQIESHANALHIYCKLLRQRLEATQPTLTEGE